MLLPRIALEEKRGRWVVVGSARDVFKNGETKTSKQSLEAIEMMYGIGGSAARDTLREWTKLEGFTLSTNPDKTKSSTFNGHVISECQTEMVH